MSRVRNATRTHQPPTWPDEQLNAPLDDGTVALSLIHVLIPLGLQAVEEALQHEVAA